MHTAHLAKKHSQLKIALAGKHTHMADTPGPERHLTQKSNKFKKSEIKKKIGNLKKKLKFQNF